MEENMKIRSYWNDYYKQYLNQDGNETSEEEESDTLGCTDVEEALQTIGAQGKVLDFGCGTGWASEYMALKGAAHITAVDFAQSAIQSAKLYAKKEGLCDQITFQWVDADWLHQEADDTYDAFFSSNVFDVIAEETSKDIFAQLKRVLKKGAKLVICLNSYFTDEMCQKRGMTESSKPRHYLEGDVLRLVCRTDEEWKEILKQYFTVDDCKIFRYEGESERNKRRLFLLTNQ